MMQPQIQLRIYNGTLQFRHAGYVVGKGFIWPEVEWVTTDWQDVPVENSDTSSEPVAKTEEQRHEWVGLSDEEIDYLEDIIDPVLYKVFARAIERKLKEKNA